VATTWPRQISRADVQSARARLRSIALRDVQNQIDAVGLGTEDGDGEPDDPRELWGEFFRSHREQLLKARQVGHNQFPIDVINKKAETYANEVMRLAHRMNGSG
jgi:hypothetical protein